MLLVIASLGFSASENKNRDLFLGFLLTMVGLAFNISLK